MSDIYLGNTEIEKAYIGDTLIYEKGGEDSGGGDSGSEEMNCVYKEITAAGTKFSVTRGVEAPIKDKRVVVFAKNTSASYSYNLQIVQSVGDGSIWYYQFTIPTNGNVLIICDPETETASLYSYSGETQTITYNDGGSSGGSDL